MNPEDDELLQWADAIGEKEDRKADSELMSWANSVPLPAPATKKKLVPGMILPGVGTAPPSEINVDDDRIESVPEGLVLARARGTSFEDAQKYAVKRMPYVGDVLNVDESLSPIFAQKKIEAGTATSEDYRRVGEYFASQLAEQEKGLLRKVADVATAIPKFGVEFITSGGVYSAAKKGALKIGDKAAGKWAKNWLAKAAIGTGARLVGVAAQTAANPQLIASETAQQMVKGLQLRQDAQGQLESILKTDDEGFLTALRKGGLSAAIELGSERTGGPIMAGLGWAWAKLPGAAKLAGLKAAVMSRWLAKPNRTLEMFNETLKKAKWDGVLGEMMEERVGEAARGMTRVADWPKYGSPEFTEQLVVEGLAFQVPGAAMHLARIVGDRAPAARTLESPPEAPQTVPPAPRTPTQAPPAAPPVTPAVQPTPQPADLGAPPADLQTLLDTQPFPRATGPSTPGQMPPVAQPKTGKPVLPWQQTQQEWLSRPPSESFLGMLRRAYDREPTSAEVNLAWQREHGKHVRQAYERGKPVPAKVLAAYGNELAAWTQPSREQKAAPAVKTPSLTSAQPSPASTYKPPEGRGPAKEPATFTSEDQGEGRIGRILSIGGQEVGETFTYPIERSSVEKTFPGVVKDDPVYQFQTIGLEPTFRGKGYGQQQFLDAFSQREPGAWFTSGQLFGPEPGQAKQGPGAVNALAALVKKGVVEIRWKSKKGIRSDPPEGDPNLGPWIARLKPSKPVPPSQTKGEPSASEVKETTPRGSYSPTQPEPTVPAEPRTDADVTGADAGVLIDEGGTAAVPDTGGKEEKTEEGKAVESDVSITSAYTSGSDVADLRWVRLPGRDAIRMDAAPRDVLIEQARRYWEIQDQKEASANQLRAKYPNRQVYEGALPTHDVNWDGPEGQYIYVLRDRRSKGKHVVLEAIPVLQPENAIANIRWKQPPIEAPATEQKPVYEKPLPSAPEPAHFAGTSTASARRPRPQPPYSSPKTAEGKKLLRRLERDASKKQGFSIGPRSIVAALTRALHARMIVARSQTTAKRPAKYLSLPHVWFTKSGVADYNLHEAGHALLTLLTDKQKLPVSLEAGLTAFAATKLSADDNGNASTANAYEGAAELLRLYLTDPGQIPGSLLSEFEQAVESAVPGAMDTIRDARLAEEFFDSRPPEQQLQAATNDRPPKPPLGAQFTAAFYEGMYHIVGPSAAWRWIEGQVWRKMTRSARATGRETLRVARTMARRLLRSIEDTPGDVELAQQSIYHVPQIVSQAIHGITPSSKGLRIHSSGEGFGDVPEAERKKLTDAGFDVPPPSKHGELIQLHNKSLADAKEAIGSDDWTAFWTWGQNKTALYRNEILGHDYPMMDRFPPDVLRKAVEKQAAEHPTWEKQYKEVQKLQDQALLLDVLSGEHSVDEVITMKRTQEDYWTLPRQLENEPFPAPGGRGAHPTSGIRRARGSQAAFQPAPEAIEQKIRRAITAYYDLRAKRAFLRMQEQMRDHPDWKDLPFEGRKFVESLLVPLKMDTKVAATLGPDEQKKLIADAINKYHAQENGGPLDEEEKIKPEDVELDKPFRPVFRSTAPRIAQVISLFDPRHPGKRQYFFVPDRLPFLLASQAGGSVPNWLMRFVLRPLARTTKPWKRILTQNWAFMVRNLIRDPITGAVLSESGAKAMLPGFIHAIGVIEKIGGKDAAERMASEMLSMALEGVTSEQHKGVWGSFKQMIGEGLADPGWSTLSPMQKMLHVLDPGTISAAIAKPLDVFNWVSGARAASQLSEDIGRTGAFAIARKQGASAEAAQRAYDIATINFTQHSKTQAIAEGFRAAGFANPAIQALWQLNDQAFHPDPRVRGMFWAAKMPIVAATSAAAAALTVLWWWARSEGDPEEFKKRIREEKNRSSWDRTRYMKVGLFKFPFEYGPIGAVQSTSHVLTMDMLMDHKGDRKILAQSILQKLADLPTLTPPHLLVASELAYNYSFFYDREVVSDALKRAHPDNPYLQAWPDTPQLYKDAARGINVSPEKLRYAVRQLLSSNADDLVAMASRIRQSRPALGEELADTPMLGRLFSREARGYASQPVKDMRQGLTDFRSAQDRLNNLRIRGKLSGTEATELEERLRGLELQRVMNNILDDVWESLKKEERKAKPDQAVIRQKEAEMTDLSARFFDLVAGKSTDPGLSKKLHGSIRAVIKNIGHPERKTGPLEPWDEWVLRRDDARERRSRIFAAKNTLKQLTGR